MVDLVKPTGKRTGRIFLPDSSHGQLENNFANW
jgi:hypothetical protein